MSMFVCECVYENQQYTCVGGLVYAVCGCYICVRLLYGYKYPLLAREGKQNKINHISLCVYVSIFDNVNAYWGDHHNCNAHKNQIQRQEGSNGLSPTEIFKENDDGGKLSWLDSFDLTCALEWTLKCQSLFFSKFINIPAFNLSPISNNRTQISVTRQTPFRENIYREH